ncbi:hypothetical protein EPD60_06070 [Flaviaesturariibacter flavus]|uniref:DUF5689 domain-containing protein n=1 Tax=Flaviaesturariibacter flavus TaxID=2502780 RepID=A0A4R1BK63_9BACT|nr:DUF5689 domain-containing protein [Flaviaesturariibacter flavus]TCJ17751.1 hypothetical protein EPD60_06070 [Flaviaesturariibacter flavus]
MNRISLKKFMAAGLATITGALVLVSCKRTYDAPPPAGVPGIVANISIKDLKALDSIPYSVYHITQDYVIRGVVNMDDKSGNYYQQISIQDSTGGIILRLAGSNLNTQYPVGRELFVKVKDLYIGEYGGMLQLGGGADSINGGVTMLSPVLQDRFIFKGALNQPVVPKLVDIASLTTDRQSIYANTLIEVRNYEFAAADTAKGFADVGASGNRVARGCSLPTSANITVRTSNFSNFANVSVPNGNGTLRGIYSFFGSTKQLSVRDTSDVQFYGLRCGATTPPPPTGGSGSTITLGTTSPYTINFNSLASGLPAGVRVGTASSATSNDTSAQLVTTATQLYWNATGGGWKSLASATSSTVTQGSGNTEQDASTDRALAVRQTGSIGDPGASVSFILANTTGKNNLKFEFELQNLDPSSGRSTVWAVEYAIGDTPASWTAVTPASGSLTTGGTTTAWGPSNIVVNLPAATWNQSQKVWVRVIARSATTGGGNRATSGFDNAKFSWN